MLASHQVFQLRLMDFLLRWVVCRKLCSTAAKRLSSLKRAACCLKMILNLMKIAVWNNCFRAWIYNSNSFHRYRSGRTSGEPRKNMFFPVALLFANSAAHCSYVENQSGTKRDKTGRDSPVLVFIVYLIPGTKRDKTGQPRPMCNYCKCRSPQPF